jgi:hypothetical protein
LEIQRILIIQPKHKAGGFQNTRFFFNVCGATLKLNLGLVNNWALFNTLSL